MCKLIFEIVAIIVYLLLFYFILTLFRPEGTIMFIDSENDADNEKPEGAPESLLNHGKIR